MNKLDRPKSPFDFATGGNAQRLVLLTPRCGAETRVTRVDEDGTCHYLIELETPAACDVNHEQRLRRRAQLLRLTIDNHRLLQIFRNVKAFFLKQAATLQAATL